MFVAQQPSANFITKELLQQLGAAFWIGLERIRNQRDQTLDIISAFADVYDSAEPANHVAGPLTLDIEPDATQPPLQQAGHLLQTGPGLTITTGGIYRVVYSLRTRTGEVALIQQTFVIRTDPYGAVQHVVCCPDTPVPPTELVAWPKFYRTPENNRVLTFSGISLSNLWSYTVDHDGDGDEYFIGEAVLAEDGSAYIRSGNFTSDTLWLNKFSEVGVLVWSVDISDLAPDGVVINVRGGVALDDAGNLYVTYSSNLINSYSSVDGSLNWSYDVSGDGTMGTHPVQFAPNIDADGKIHIVTGGSSFTSEAWAYRFNTDGTVDWKTLAYTGSFGDGLAQLGCAALSGDHVYYVGGLTHLVALNRLIGSIEWTTAIAEAGGSYTTNQLGIVVAGGNLYELWPISKISPSENSERTAWGTIADLALGTDAMVNGLGGYGAFASLPVVDSEGNVYTASKYSLPGYSNFGRITKYDSSGVELWHFAATVDGESFFPPVLANNCLIATAGGDNAFPIVSLGHVYFLDPADGTLLGTTSYAAAGSEITHGIGVSGASLNGAALYIAMGRTLHVYATV